MLRMILGSPPVNFKWGLFPWSLGQCNLTRTSVFSFWFKESLMDFWCTFDALLHFWCAFDALSKTLLQAALHKLYLRCIQWTLLGTDCILFFNFEPKIITSQTKLLYKCFWCTFDALLMHFWCSLNTFLMRFWCAFEKCIKNGSKTCNI
jgi:hypothetical protein